LLEHDPEARAERRSFGQAHNLPQEAPRVFAEAIVDVAEI
jgi:hypothetical protein